MYGNGSKRIYLIRMKMGRFPNTSSD